MRTNIITLLLLFIYCHVNAQSTPWKNFFGKKIETVSEVEQKSSGGKTTINGIPSEIKSTSSKRSTIRETSLNHGKKEGENVITCRIVRIQVKTESPTGLQYDSENTFERNPAYTEYYEQTDRYVGKRVSRTIETQAPDKVFLTQWQGGLPPTHYVPELCGIFLNSVVRAKAKAGESVSDTIRSDYALWTATYNFASGSSGRWLVKATFLPKKTPLTAGEKKAPSGSTTSERTEGDYSGELEVDRETGFIYKANLTRQYTTIIPFAGTNIEKVYTSNYTVTNTVAK